ncbi:GNAT family N-acetyltransferase [Frigidibacter sp.]|uniref:GNAT family N-acetyltransferase n=1 Tax=Frigidibacter sp. TaxID=2586418 RepID=UPI002736C136|nr:GNAT family protein [Frigidibacter sp.]MDP3340703.1 GNAT family protein [Frigidibacter sp.]
MTTQHKALGIPLPQADWPLPVWTARSGRYVDLVPLSVDHADLLWPAVVAAPESFTYLRYGPFTHPAGLRALLGDLSQRSEQPFWVVIPKGGVPQGWLSICDVFPKDGSIEIGSIWFSPELQGTRAAREAIFLLMCHAMDDLGYERLVWRCQAQNTKSFRAAKNLGFTYEGTWRRAAVVDGWQRDVAWFSILKDEWPHHRLAMHNWLVADNFDASGRQITRLGNGPVAT